MERGEEEAPTAAVLHFSATISADLKAVRFRRAAAENFRPEIFDARATLREQRESAVGRRSAKPQEVPVCPETAPHASATATPQVRPCLLGIEECPHYFIGEKSVASMYTDSTFSTILPPSASEAAAIAFHAGSVLNPAQFFFAASRLACEIT